MDEASLYRVVQGDLAKIPGTMKDTSLPDGATILDVR